MKTFESSTFPRHCYCSTVRLLEEAQQSFGRITLTSLSGSATYEYKMRVYASIYYNQIA